MNRPSILTAVVLSGAVSMAVGAAQQPAPGAGQGRKPRTVEVEKVKDNLFVLRGGGGNTAVFVRTDGVTVVDTKDPGWGQPILDTIKELTDKPVTMIVNTHTHGDHVSGNVEFPASVAVVTHENTKENMTRMVSPPGLPGPSTPPPNIFVEHKGRGVPTRTFTDRLTLGAGADQVDLYYFGRGHTNGDAMIVFPALRAMHMGDLFPGKQMPIMDANNGGSAVEYAATLKKVHDGVKGVETIITGHSTLLTPRDLLEYSEFIREFVAAVRTAAKTGQTAAQIAEAWRVPGKYSGYAAPQSARLRSNVELILKESR